MNSSMINPMKLSIHLFTIFLIFLFQFPTVIPHSLSIKTILLSDNSIANGISIALLSTSTNKYLNKDFLPLINSTDPSPEFFFVNTWDLPWNYDSSSAKLKGELQLRSFSSGLWAMALNNGGSRVQVPSKKPWGWETFSYERIGNDSLVLKKGEYYLRVFNNEIWADGKNFSIAEKFIIKKINERVEPNIFGVNLGGWLVPEKWMAPSLFKGSNATSQYDLCKELTQELCKQLLQRHYETFFDIKNDLVTIQSKGINLVRIPIGYWATKPEEQISPHTNISLNYLDKAFEICDQLNLAIIVDLHGVQGSQNGWDHSGWARDTQHWTDNWEENMRDTIESLVFLTKRYTNRPSFFGIELVNEPLYTIPLQKLTEFYYKSYEEIRKINKEVIIIMSDSFRGHAVESTTFIPKISPNFTRVMIDIHNYQCFNEEDKKLTTEQHLEKVENEWLKVVSALSKHNLVITGEWSLALEWHTYLGLQPDEIKTFKKIYFLTQKNIFEAGDGSVFWSWRLQESDTSWSMERLFNDGYID